MKKIILMAAFLLSGCIYEQSPAPINAVDIIDDTQSQPQQPTSISYPLPDAPKNINNVIVNQPQPVPNNAEIQNDQTIITNSIDTNPINSDNSSNVPVQNNDQLIDSIISNDNPAQNTTNQNTNTNPVGSFNNPVKFDQSKVY